MTPQCELVPPLFIYLHAREVDLHWALWLTLVHTDFFRSALVSSPTTRFPRNLCSSVATLSCLGGCETDHRAVDQFRGTLW